MGPRRKTHVILHELRDLGTSHDEAVKIASGDASERRCPESVGQHLSNAGFMGIIRSNMGLMSNINPPNKNRPERRTLLKTAGFSLALPCLESMPRTTAAVPAAKEPKAKRLICVGSNLGYYRDAFYPEQPGVDYETSELLRVVDQHRNDFTVFSGLDHRSGNGHKNWDNFLCGRNIGSVSLDQRIAEHVGGSTRFPSIQLCAGDIPAQRMVFTREGVPLPMINRPSVIYQKLFTSEQDRARTDYLLRSGRSALDTVREEASQLQRRISHGDKQKLAEYFDSLRELERRMGRQLKHLADDVVKVDYELPAYDPVAPTLMLECEQIMFDLMALALETDSTRVATMFIAGLGQVFTLDGRTMRAGYHALSHHGNDPDVIRDLIRVETEHLRCLDRFLTQLKEKSDEHGNPLLDSTIVLFGTGMGDASRHSNRDLPTLVAGGGFKHGQHIAVDPKKDPQLLGDLFLTMMHQFGMEVDSFSDATRGLSDWA